jgi:predicted nucleic acid-binding protein
MIILDTNVVSALMNDPPDEQVVAWLNRQPESSIWVSSVTILEIEFGLHVIPGGKRRTGLADRFERVLQEMDRRIAVFDEDAARATASLMVSWQKKGRPRDFRDTMIAGIVLALHASLATRHVAHFSDIPATVVNPWSS